MFKGFRLYLVALAVLVAFFVTDTKNASAVVDPLTGYVVASALLHAVVLGGAYVAAKFAKRENGGTRNPSGTKVTPQGTIGRDAKITYIDLTKTDFVDSKNVTAKLSLDKLDSVYNSGDGNPKYPRLSSALIKNVPENVYTGNGTGVNGQLVHDKRNGNYKRVTGVGSDTWTRSPSTPSAYSGPGLYTSGSSTVYIYQFVAGGYPTGGDGYRCIIVTSSQNDTPTFTKRMATPQEFSSTLSNIPAGITAPADVYSDYYGEIDDFIKDNPNIVEYVDTDDSALVDYSSPYSPQLPTYSQYADAVAGKSANDALASAQGAVDAAQGAVSTAQQNYSASGSPADLQKLQDAQKSLADSQAALDKLKSDLAQKLADQAKEDAEKETDNPVALDAPGDVPDLDFSRFAELKGALSSTYPFSLISTLPDLLSPFNRPPSAPVIHLPVYGNDMVVDLSIFDPVAAVCRWCLGVLATAGVVFYVVHFYRGVS